ncbi:mRNA triphosphatase CET1 [Tuber magnatum]|uniref:mRNA-capping enzyme subunit beta n=1 Tax=Tuber magnatum TaxID=42249 RepID=A0A317SYL5_9PEZI|nr:mRNA triphosphatase CET1 [Tuber magnatum]
MMDLDGGSGVAPGPALGPGQKWGSPVAERAKPNGAVGTDGRDSQGPHHLAPQQQPQPTQPQPPSNPNCNSNPSQQPPSQPSSGATSQRTSTVSPSNKEQPHPPPSSLTLQTEKSTPTPVPTSIHPRHPPPRSSSSPKATQQLGPPPAPSHNQAIVEGGNSDSPGPSGPPKKRVRRDEAPIWARKASRSSSSSPVLANRRQPSSANQHQPLQQQQPPPLPPPPPQQHQKPPPASGFTPRFVPCFGPWEPSICNTEPHEELTREVANFLFNHVACQNDPALTPSGGDGPVVMIEIEAKIGHLIDKERGERLKLPVITETVLNVNEPGWKIQFKSSMTEHPNENSRPPTGPQRIPMEYVHTHERDTFFELPPDKLQALPDILRTYMRHKPKVRVTFDQKTGKVINKIIKTRIADLNVYSPKTAFDWRVSANIEMPYLGDIDGLQPSSDRGGGDRNKDRVSYRHLAYQIDLTQVTDNTAKKEHELEVEVSGAEIIRHGNLARESKPNAYEFLVRGFVDNVRVLIRAIES